MCKSKPTPSSLGTTACIVNLFIQMHSFISNEVDGIHEHDEMNKITVHKTAQE